jgi:hypothetical protein
LATARFEASTTFPHIPNLLDQVTDENGSAGILPAFFGCVEIVKIAGGTPALPKPPIWRFGIVQKCITTYASANLPNAAASDRIMLS